MNKVLHQLDYQQNRLWSGRKASSCTFFCACLCVVSRRRARKIAQPVSRWLFIARTNQSAIHPMYSTNSRRAHEHCCFHCPHHDGIVDFAARFQQYSLVATLP